MTNFSQHALDKLCGGPVKVPDTDLDRFTARAITDAPAGSSPQAKFINAKAWIEAAFLLGRGIGEINEREHWQNKIRRVFGL